MHEVVVDASLFDEGALAFRDDIRQDGRKSVGQELGEDLRETVYEADRSIVRDVGGIRLLGDENDVRGVYEVDAPPSEVGQLKNRSSDVAVDNVPAGLEEGSNKPIRTRRFDRGQRENGVLDLIFAEGDVKVGEVVDGVVEALPIKADLSCRLSAKDAFEVRQQHLFLVLLSDSSARGSAESLDVDLATTAVSSGVKELGVSVSQTDPSEPRSLS